MTTHSAWSRLIIADPGLTDSLGHHLGYSVSVAAAARAGGLDATILAGRDFQAFGEATDVLPHFAARYQSAARPSVLRGAIYSAASRLPGPLAHGMAQGLRAVRRLALRSAMAHDGFGAELARYLAQSNDADRALVLLHSVSAANLSGLIGVVPPASVGGLAVVLRRTRAEMDTTDAAPEPIASVLPALGSWLGSRLRLFADTEELAAIYTPLAGRPVTPVPLPVVTPPIRSGALTGMAHVVFAGGARAEKGYHLLPNLLPTLAGRTRVTIHSGVVGDNADPLVQAAHRALRRADVTLVERSLSPAAYLDLIGSADLLLLPYDAAAYGPRSSGILAEARAMGVPAIVPAGTWMAAQAGPSASVIFAGPDDLVRAVSETLTNLPTLAAAYRLAARNWRDRHNPERLFLTLAGAGVPVVSPTLAPV